MTTEDQRDIFERTKIELEKIIFTGSLTPEQKSLLKTAVEFGYATAFSKRTYDINGNYIGAEKYEKGYSELIKKLE